MHKHILRMELRSSLGVQTSHRSTKTAAAVLFPDPGNPESPTRILAPWLLAVISLLARLYRASSTSENWRQKQMSILVSDTTWACSKAQRILGWCHGLWGRRIASRLRQKGPLRKGESLSILRR
jgi:hypothetical protein